MLNTDRQPWLLGGWLATVAGIVAVRVTMGANVSTASLLVALGVASAIVMALVKRSAWPPTVAEILHAVHTKNGTP
jgi:CBS-domain-containing membrane protein